MITDGNATKSQINQLGSSSGRDKGRGRRGYGRRGCGCGCGCDRSKSGYHWSRDATVSLYTLGNPNPSNKGFRLEAQNYSRHEYNALTKNQNQAVIIFKGNSG